MQRLGWGFPAQGIADQMGQVQQRSLWVLGKAADMSKDSLEWLGLFSLKAPCHCRARNWRKNSATQLLFHQQERAIY